MGKVTALEMDTITEGSGHQMTGIAVSVCLTPAAPAPLPIPYPTMGTVSEGITDPCMRTKIEGEKILTVGGCMKCCHGNEAGTLKEVVSLNTAGPCFPWLGAPVVFIELGMAGITGSMGQMNKSITVGAGANASGAGGGGSGSGAGGGDAGGPGGPGNQSPSNSGGGGGGSNSGAAPPNPPAAPGADGQAKVGHPVDVITGTMFTAPAVDVDLRGPLPLQWIRQYRTSAVRRQQGIGWGWTHSFAWSAEIGPRGITVFDSEGSPVAFPPLADGEIAYAPFGRSLERRGDELVLATSDHIERVLVRVAPGHHRLSEVRDASGNTTTLEWKGDALVALTDCVGRRMERELSASTVVWWLVVTDGDGKEHRRLAVSYEIDARGDLVRVVDMGGASIEYRYDDEHFLVEERLPDGLVYHFRYEDGPDGKRRCVETWGELPGRDILSELSGGIAPRHAAKGILHMRLTYGPGPFEATLVDATGGSHRYRGNALGLVEEYTDPLGRSTQLSFDAQGHLAAVCDPMGYVERMRFDAMGRLLTSTDRLGRLTRLRRDEAGNTVEVVDPAGGTWKMDRDGKGRLVRRADPSGSVTRCEYDDRGRTVRITGPGGAEQMRYDAHGNLVEKIDVRGARSRYRWDLIGLPVKIETVTGAVYELQYDSRGDTVVAEGPHGRRVERSFDASRRVVAERHPGGGVTAYAYLGGVLVDRVSPDGARLRAGYDAMLRLLWIENAAGERHQFGYDDAGQLVWERTFAGIEHQYAYDGAGRCIRKSGPDRRALELTRDAEGQIVRREHGGAAVTFEHDERGHVTRAQGGAVSVELMRDLSGRVVRETQRVGGFSFTVKHEFDPLGYEVGTHYSTGWYVSRRRGPAGALDQLSVHGADGSVEEALELLRGDEDVTRRRGRRDGIATTRDKLGRPARTRVLGEDGEVIRERTWEWAPQPGALRVVDTEKGPRAYELDVLGRPVRAGGLGMEETYTYAPQGTPMARGEGSCRIGAGGRKLATSAARFTWDARGRLAQRLDDQPARSWAYTYDDEGRLSEARRGDGFAIRYLYDPFGRRVAAIREDGSSTYFGWDRDAMVEEVHSAGAPGRYVFWDDQYTPLLARAADTAGWQLVATDAVSTPWLYLGADGSKSSIDLDPMGREASIEGRPAALRFAGQRKDAETGLCYNRHRYYSPELGLFLTPDPLGLAGSLHDVGFVPNATEFMDPLGLVIIVGSYDSETMQSASLRAASTGQEIVRADDLYGPHNPNGTPIVGETHVEVITHGTDGKCKFSNGSTGPTGQPKNWFNGNDLGTALNNAGLEPNAQVVVVACNAATTPAKGQSVIAGVNQATGNPVSGPSSITYVKPMYDPTSGRQLTSPGNPGSVDLTNGHWAQATGPKGGTPSVTNVSSPSSEHADTW